MDGHTISSYFIIHLFVFNLHVDVGAPPTGLLAPLTPTAPPASSADSTDAGSGSAAAAPIETTDQQQPLPKTRGDGQNNTSRVFEIQIHNMPSICEIYFVCPVKWMTLVRYKIT